LWSHLQKAHAIKKPPPTPRPPFKRQRNSLGSSENDNLFSPSMKFQTSIETFPSKRIEAIRCAVRIIVRNSLPYNFITDPDMKKLFQHTYSCLPTRHEVSNEITSLGEKHKSDLKRELSGKHICLMLDSCSSSLLGIFVVI
jgi:hypothetical protein